MKQHSGLLSTICVLSGLCLVLTTACSEGLQTDALTQTTRALNGTATQAGNTADPLSSGDGTPWRITDEDHRNLRCLLSVYPGITRIQADADGLWLVVQSGARVLYGPWQREEEVLLSPDPSSSCSTPYSPDTDVRTSMAQPYLPDPERVETPQGYAPGRRRSYGLLHALYGADQMAVRRNLRRITAFGRSWMFVPAAAEAFLRAARDLEAGVAADPSLRPWLVGSGSFCWRRIAGENVLSAHSFGIAFDTGVRRGAAYWRWSGLRPHPQQKTFPTRIVEAFEKQGFIWGGKWHEYDIMHFEYRPELLCRARNRDSTGTVYEAVPGTDREMYEQMLRERRPFVLDVVPVVP